MSSHTCKGTKQVKWDMEGTHGGGGVPEAAGGSAGVHNPSLGELRA